MVSPGRPADRGQLLIVAAVGLAILLTALALALNTAAYAEVHVSETDTGLQEERDAVRYQESVRRAVAGMIGSNSSIETESGLRANLAEWTELASPGHARDGAATNATLTDTTIENRIVQDDARAFEDQSGAADWTVASNVSAVDAYETEVQAADLATTDDCASTEECFALTVEDDDGDTWRMFVYSSSGNETVEVDVETANGSDYYCKAEASSTSINVTGGAFVEEDGTECTFESFTQDDQVGSSYTLRYESAGNVSGTYNLSVTGDVVNGSIEEDERYDATGSPRIDPDVVAANVSIRYQSPDLRYEAEIRVVPGDADG